MDYPFSRRDRFRIMAVLSGAQELLVLVTLLFAICGEVWGKQLSGGGDQGIWFLAIRILLMTALIAIPLMQWAALYKSRRQIPAAIVLLVLSWGVIVAGFSILPHFRAAAFSPVGLLVAAGLAIVAHATYFQRLRCFCLRADLVLRSS